MSAYFELILCVLTLASLLIVALDKWVLARFRPSAAPKPLLARYAYELWSVFLVVWLLRSFVFDIVDVPTGSMLPTIQLGDYVLVERFAYGIRMPLTGKLLIPVGSPHQGDIMVFHYPVNPEVDFIKTVIGLPGDRISYINKQLYVNGVIVPQHMSGTALEPNDSSSQTVMAYQSHIGAHQHTVYLAPWKPDDNFKDLVVPAGEYFVMGDNRDFSADSRYWGFVPEQAVIGKAVRILISWDSSTHSMRWHRIGQALP